MSEKVLKKSSFVNADDIRPDEVAISVYSSNVVSMV